MFSKILIANRGEIAVRIIRACNEMGIRTVAVFSEADCDALHVNMADESFCIGPGPVKDSYLNVSAILTAAVLSKAEAIHPGYGLLSENYKFAQMCEQCNIAFIGPPFDIIKKMGDKDAARKLMKEAGVPVIPGSGIVKDIHEANECAKQIGFPLLIKASAGGGGKGIRKVDKESDFEKAFFAASAEAKNAFGDERVYLEKYLSPVKHIEMQVMCDNFGNTVCLGERECSMQRKNQKLIEESPSPAVTEELRQKIIKASLLAVKAVGYRNIGTIEYLLTGDGNFYFMEMNTRLQVEHPVTEMVTGVDLVKWQIRLAAGAELEFSQSDIKMKGCAIECRINAEDALHGFRPSSGRITLLHIPGGPWVRFDTAIYQDYFIPPYYDSMIGKLIVHARTRVEAIRKMQAALCELVIEGVEHTRELQIELVSEQEFREGTYTTDHLLRKEGGSL
ncbi:MAG: Biotin carboxylase [Firmicutes bacterium ADurb.Bin182]|nr:MAG: Biotin carboxylase [Firmicutes bacterium ADurb.Bin182]